MTSSPSVSLLAEIPPTEHFARYRETDEKKAYECAPPLCARHVLFTKPNPECLEHNPTKYAGIGPTGCVCVCLWCVPIAYRHSLPDFVDKHSPIMHSTDGHCYGRPM